MTQVQTLALVRLRLDTVRPHAVRRGRGRWDVELPRLKTYRLQATPQELALARWFGCGVGPRPSPESSLTLWDRAAHVDYFEKETE